LEHLVKARVGPTGQHLEAQLSVGRIPVGSFYHPGLENIRNK
jgi:hypothetical protein